MNQRHETHHHNYAHPASAVALSHSTSSRGERRFPDIAMGAILGIFVALLCAITFRLASAPHRLIMVIVPVSLGGLGFILKLTRDNDATQQRESFGLVGSMALCSFLGGALVGLISIVAALFGSGVGMLAALTPPGRELRERKEYLNLEDE